MVFLITGASHTGKTLLSQKLLERFGYPCFSIDHLKMGLIRSGNTSLTPLSDEEELTAYLWPIVREMIKTAIENDQNLIVEGCYVPLDWEKDFEAFYREKIRFCCLIMSESYLREHFDRVKAYANVIEKRLDDEDYTAEAALKENRALLLKAQKHAVVYRLIDGEYRVDFPEE